MGLIQQLRREEGVVPHAYQDHLGFWTIGCGRLIDRRKGGGLSDAEIDFLLANDIERFTREVRKALPWFDNLNEPRKAVLIGMAFQMGTHGLLGFRNTLAAIRDERYEHAAGLMMQSLWARQTPNRARRMSQQMATGEWQA
jgi:lysozyme